jgi:hypothetical protein
MNATRINWFGHLIVHAVLWAALLAGMVLLVPRYEKTFRDFNVRLPEATVRVLNAAQLLINHFDYLPWLGLGFVAVDGAILFSLSRGSCCPGAARVYTWGMTALPLVLAALTALAIWLPLEKIREGLAR